MKIAHGPIRDGAALRNALCSLLLAAAVGGCGLGRIASSGRTGGGVRSMHRGRSLKLSGASLRPGDPSPDAELYTIDGDSVKLSSYGGRVLVLSVVPELGTPICDLTTRKLERAAAGLPQAIAVVTVSSDSVVHQAAWRRKNGVRRAALLSDGPGGPFGAAYGLSLPRRKRLARAMLVIDADRVIRHVEVVGDLDRPPDVDAALAVARELAAPG